MQKLIILLITCFMVACTSTVGRKVDFSYRNDIVKKKTTIEEVLKRLGKPNGIQDLGAGIKNYEYTYATASDFGSSKSEILMIQVKDGIVQDFSYSNSNY